MRVLIAAAAIFLFTGTAHAGVLTDDDIRNASDAKLGEIKKELFDNKGKPDGLVDVVIFEHGPNGDFIAVYDGGLGGKQIFRHRTERCFQYYGKDRESYYKACMKGAL